MILKIFILLAAIYSNSAHAWLTDGHQLLTKEAIKILPRSMPRFFLNSKEAIAHHAVDPDITIPSELPTHAHHEKHKHYLDYEYLGGATISKDYQDYLNLLQSKGLQVTAVGDLPYSITEYVEKLSLAFAEHRRWPGNQQIKQKCLLYAGYLAHYAQDSQQPLHTSAHHDGRIVGDIHNPSPRTGIHRRVDSLVEKYKKPFIGRSEHISLDPIDAVFDSVLEEILRSHGFVNAVYDFDSSIPAVDAPLDGRNEQLNDFIKARGRASILFTARLMLTAWNKSLGLQLPKWLKR